MLPKRSIGGAALAASLVPVLVGLVASAILAVDYSRSAPVFCRDGGGCDAVRHTVLASALGVPTPFIGLVGFLAIGASSLWAGQRARLTQAGLSSIAAVIGAFLLAAQGVLRLFCPYCFAADVASIACAAVAWWRFARAADAPSPKGLVLGGAGSMVLAALLPVAIGLRLGARPVPTPVVIRAEIARTPSEKVTVVDFVDFECPFCRMTHAVLEPLLAAHADRVRWVRRQVPLHIHAHALDAARAALCGESLGRGDAMANALFATPVDDLTREGCEKVALGVGLAPEPYRACVADPKTDAHIEGDRAEFNAAGGYALPTIWIDQTSLVGAQSRETLAQTLDRALARH